MIEGNNTNELTGQMDLGDVLNEGTGNSPKGLASLREQGTGIAEGYDADGHLLDYTPDPAEGIPYAPPAILDAPPTQSVGTPYMASDCRGADAAPAPAIPSEVPVIPSEVPVIPSEVVAEGLAQRQGSSSDRLTALAVEINAITEQTRGVVISAALAVGKRLIEAKSLCPEGRWTEWLAKSVNYSERKAQDMMRLYTEYGRDGQIPDSIAALDYSKAVALLSAPAEAREELAIKAGAEDLSVRQLQAEIKALKEETGQQRMVIDGLRRENNSVRDDGQALQNDNDKLEAELKQTRDSLATAAEKIAAANAKADAAESAAAELRKLHSDAEDRAAANAQRASDAVNRANQTAKDLAEARAKIAALEEQARSGDNLSPQVETVEVIPEAVTRELEDLRAQLAEAKANQGTGNREQGTGATAVERFKLFYSDTMKPAFTTALNLLREVAKEDGQAADAFATALTKACQMLMNQLGTK